MTTDQRARNVAPAALESSPSTNFESGLRNRFDPLRVPEYVAQSMREIDGVLRNASTVASAFDRVVAVLKRLLPLNTVAIVRDDPRHRAFVWCKQRRERNRVGAETAAAAALRWFRETEEGAREGHSALDALLADGQDAMSLPLVNAEDGKVLGLLSVSTSRPPDEAMLLIVSTLSTSLAELLARSDHAARPSSEERKPTLLPPPPASILGELTSLLFDSLDYASTLQQVTRILGSQLGSACVIDITGPRPKRIVHAPFAREGTLSTALRSLSKHLAHRTTGIASKDDLIARHAAHCLGCDWLVCAPLHHHGSGLGTITLAGKTPHEELLPLADVEELGRRAAAAIENGRLYERAVAEAQRRADLLSTVSHDLKNPLGVILLSANMMLDGVPQVDRRRAGRHRLEAIHRSAKRIHRLVEDLLDISAIDGAALKMQPARCHVHALVDEAIATVTAAANDAGVELCDELTPDLPSAWVDPDRLLQVLTNLLGNAIKFTPNGGRVAIAAKVIGETLHISVADTGIGIGPADLPHIFDRFWQAPSRSKLGSGLGLAICKAIVELSGGRITAESEPGIGTTITFTLPRAGHRVELGPPT